jgi:hypothetical protein
MKLKGGLIMKGKICQMPSEYADQPTTTVTLEMPVLLVEKLKEAATLDGTDYQAIINCYVQQGLSNNMAEVKRLQFEEHAKEILEKHGVNSNVVDDILSKIQF